MIAILSDIHANYDALQAVLEQIDRLRPETIICLGDIVGYGPEPVACVDEVRKRCTVTLCGNHDFALIYGANDFTALAQASIERHRKLMMPHPGDGAEATRKRERWAFLKGLPYRHAHDHRLMVHASPRNPVVEYLRKVDVLLGLGDKIKDNFRQMDWICFIGHTHQPGIITRDMKFLEPAEIGGVYAAQPHQKAIINVGSVGQPRDGDWRACFVTVDDHAVVRYHRVEYDVENAASKMAALAAAGVDDSLPERLRRGR